MDSKTMKKIAKRRTKVLLSPIKNYLINRDYNQRAKYSKWFKKMPIKNNYVFYETRDGKSMTDSPYAIFKYLSQQLKWKDLIHVWAISDKDYLKALEKKYQNWPNIKFVLKNSDPYFKYLATCKYLFNNSTFTNIYTVKEGQVYTNTWHGTPLKHMGFDIEGSPMGTSNVLRNFLGAAFILSPNKFTTDILKNGFRLNHLYNGTIVEEGYPRIDLTVNADKDELAQLLAEEQIDLGNKKTILYAPTWKGDAGSKPRNDIEQISNDVNKLEEKFGNEYKILMKVHPFLYKFAIEEPQLKGKLVPDTFETNELLSVVDILITDYSSIFFDYLVTGKPILFYMWDYDDYNKNRGMYIDTDNLPGPICTDIEDLIESIGDINNVQKNYEEVYQSFTDQFCYHDYGNVTEKVVQHIFGLAKKKQSKHAITPVSDKEKILIYPGGLQNNGITGSVLNLLDNIDYNKYDVTVLVNYSNKQYVQDNLLRINSNARIAFKSGRISQTVMEDYRNYITKNRGLTTDYLKRLYPENMYEREYKRIVGISEFDYAIDFSGYAMFWPSVLLAGNASKKMVILHSDMFSDMYRHVNGRNPHFINLRGVFSLYKYFDELVSVSEATMEVNKENLEDYIGDTKISYLINSINTKKIRSLSNDDSEVYMKQNKPVLVNVKSNKEIFDVPVPDQGEGYTNFVNMGRLSPEKGQDQLIEAFAEVHKKNDRTRLYIIGEGPSRKTLEELIKLYELEDAVYLVGHKSNPFYLMGQCDAFVLSSHYEGHPLVLLESLTLGLQTVSTDITASRYVLEDGKYGKLVENSIAGLAGGMESVIEADEKPISFDVEAFNEQAMESFYRTLD
ncbi:glycosyltransferase [Virgibacillus ihumii]|uniref:glycosyltransferase n=1 Tax=Virgibacillus ihumii TaxID=2686091 RepID=UPI00157C39F3|nr:glycosyltransferase [Virgibacillus ihumii]